MLNPNNSIEQETYPLSPLQQGMLFHYLYNQEGGEYIQQFICRLHEALNIPAFEQSWQKVIERHSILRTRFQWEGLEQPQQIVHKQVECPLKIQDLCDLSSKTQKKQIADYIQQDRKQGFSLTEAPVMRFTLFQLSEDNYQFIWTSHHILLDGRSRFLILREFFTLYAAYSQNQEIDLPEPHPYKEYIDWLQQQDFSKSEQFWQKTLKGVQAPTPLINGWVNNSDSVAKLTYADKTLHLTETLTKDLQSLVKSADLTLNTLMQGVWALLLSRYSGEETVIFGATRACRYWTDIEPELRIGLFINTLPVCTRIVPDLDLSTWLQNLHHQWVAIKDHNILSLTEIQKCSEIPANLRLFETLIVFEDNDINIEPASGYDWTECQFELPRQDDYPLSLYVMADTRLHLTFKYEPQRFDAATINRMSGHFQTLLEGIVANPKQRISALPWLTKAERHQLLVEWNANQIEYSQQCAHHLFEAQVKQHPDAVAIVFEDQALTYQELNIRSNKLANYLQALTVGPEVIVGLCMERSLDIVVGLLGILKAGGAHLSLDPNYPKERIAFMLKDTQVSVLLTQQQLLNWLPPSKARIVCLDSDWKTIIQESKENPVCQATLENLAYVIYTSGSTGNPKGVMINHAGLCRYVQSIRVPLKLNDNDTYLHTASFGFSASVRQLMVPLTHALKVVLASIEQRANPLKLFELIKQQCVTIVDFSPSYWRNGIEVLNRLDTADKQSLLNNKLRLILSSAEPLSSDIPKRWRQYIKADTYLLNMYGQTETTGMVSFYPLPKLDHDQITSVPIGKPLPNVQLYLLDVNLQPVPIGVVGELYIGGPQSARGYINLPERSASTFMAANPFSTDKNARMCKTGDLARYRPDGTIEFIGRLDNQVKIRGFRIELGEIEVVLAQHHSVRENAVIVQEISKTEPHLIAFIVAQSEQVIDNAELRAFLTDKLPEYMVPSYFVTLESLPLTPNGKIDRRALSQLSVESWKDSEDTFVAPRTPEEELLAGIWVEVLGIERVGVQDNFFELGGHSLHAARFIAAIHEKFKVDLPLRSLFDHPTIVAQADIIVGMDEVQDFDSDEPRTQNLSSDIPLSENQRGWWLFEQLYPNTPTYHIVLAFKLTGVLNLSAFERAVNEIRRRHNSLRTTFSLSRTGIPQQHIAPYLPSSIIVKDVSTLPIDHIQTETNLFIAEGARHPFDLTKDSLMRISLLRVQKNEHLLSLTFQHLISDGWSRNLFLDELSILYSDFSNNQPASLLEPAAQYSDFCFWQQQWLASKEKSESQAYWQAQCQEIPVLLLPNDKPRPPHQTYVGARQTVSIAPDLTNALRQLSQQQGVTLFMTLLAGFKVLLYSYTGQKDLSVGTAVAGRNRVQWEKVIGLFINSLPLRTQIDSSQTFTIFLRQVREITLAAYSHQTLPFQMMVDLITSKETPNSRLNSAPLFQTFFLLQNFETSDLRLSGLTAMPLDVDTGTAKIDLTLELYEKSDGSLTGWFEYNSDLFSLQMVQRMVGHLTTLLAGIVENPEQKLRELPLLTKEELETTNQRITSLTTDSHSLTPNSLIPKAIAAVRTPEPEKVKELRKVIENQLSWDVESQESLQSDTHQRCSPAIFILSPPRSGSTLLRVMLAGSPDLFAPPELELLSFTNLKHRHLALSIRHESVLEGLIRAVMALKECTIDEARQIIKEYEQQAITTPAFYAQLQTWCGTKKLVDKSIHYAISPKILQRAEQYFEGALYIHLTRHPYGTVSSIEKLRLEQNLFGHIPHFTSRELVEYTWLISHENILSFLQEVPKSRQYRVRFEDLVKQPKHILKGLCDFLDLPFNAEMLEPHKEKYQRMTDTLTGSRIGDPNFHEHQTIDAQVAESWKKDFTPSPLSEHSLAIASRLGYWDVSYPHHLDREVLLQTNLAPNQLLIWLRLQYSPKASPIFYTAYRFNLPLAIQPAIFIQAFADIVQASDALCSIFSEVQGIPQRQVLPAIENSMEFLDFSKTEDNLSDWLTQRIEKLVDVTQKCFDCVLIKLADEQFVWYFKAHQIIIDDWSFNLLFHLMAARYHDLLTDPSTASLLIPSYQDHVAQQRHYLNADKYQEDARFWTEYAVFHPLSWYGKQQITSSTNTYLYTLKLPQATQDRLQNWHKAGGEVSPQSQSVDLVNLIATALAVYLRKITQSEEISIGTIQHNWLNQQAKQTIGQFMQVLPLILHIDNQEDLTSLYQRVKRQHQQVLHHSQFVLPNPPHEPIYQVMISHVHHHFNDFCGVPVEVERLHSGHSAEILTLHLHDFSNAGQLRLHFEFNQKFFSPELCSLAVGHFQQALETMLEHPEHQVHQVSLMTPQEVRQLLAWNQTATDYPTDKTIVDLFEQQVKKTPDNIAVVFEEQSVNYQQLNEKANQLAHYLFSLKTQAGTILIQNNLLIAISVERSLEMVIGLLGILKAGGAYVPIDPDYPPARIRYMLDDSMTPLLLTQSRLKAHLPLDELEQDCVVVCLDETDFADQPTENPTINRKTDDLAYVIYTSGSTGKPKGVMIEHSALGNFIHSSINVYALTSHDKILQFASVSFDTAAEEIYPTLLQGAVLILRTEEMLGTTETFLTTCDEQKLTVLDLPTAYWHSLLTDMQIIKKYWPTSIRLVLIGGEAVSGEKIRQWLEIFGHFPALLNTYGPTETTVVATVFPFDTSSINDIITVSIGQPIANTRIYILDAVHQPLPTGIPGELCIAGKGLARGYLNRPSLTSEKFIEVELFGKTERIYKTGDLARWLPDGNK